MASKAPVKFRTKYARCPRGVMYARRARMNNPTMGTFLLLGVVVAAVALTAMGLLRAHPPGHALERVDDLPSLHSVVSSFSKSGTHAGPLEDTEPAFLGRPPGWDSK